MSDMPTPIVSRYGSETNRLTNMSFVSIAYVISCCLLLPWLVRRPHRWAIRVLNAINVWLPLYSIFLVQQWLGIYQLSRLMPASLTDQSFTWYRWIDLHLVAQIIIITLPFAFWWQRWRGHRALTLLLVITIYFYHPFRYWDLYQWPLQAAKWISLLCISFSIFWLSRSFSDQPGSDV
jgi:hypothetical protein